MSARYNRTVMSDAPSIPIPAPTIRFRLRSLILATTMLALVAAPAGWFFRQQSEAAQMQLAAMWTAFPAFLMLALFYRYLRIKRIPLRAGECRCFVTTTRASLWRSCGLIACMAIVTASWSTLLSRSGLSFSSLAFPVWMGACFGVTFAGALQTILSWPVPLCERGLIENGKFRPWTGFFRAEWVASRPRVVRLHRLEQNYLFEGDLFLRVLPEQHAAVAAMFDELQACRFQRSAAA